MGSNQTDKLLHSKGNKTKQNKTKQNKRQPTEWEKIVSNDETDKGLISKIYKKTYTLNSNKKQPNGKMGKGPEYTFLQGRYTHGQQHMKKHSTSLITREMQI